MIKIEKNEDNYITYSDENFMIKPIYDRLGEEINPDAIYGIAEDIEVDGQPRFDYEETDIKREVIKDEENIDENMEQ